MRRNIGSLVLRVDEHSINRESVAQIKRNHAGTSAFAATGQRDAPFPQPASARNQVASLRVRGDADDDRIAIITLKHGVYIFRKRARLRDCLEPLPIHHSAYLTQWASRIKGKVEFVKLRLPGNFKLGMLFLSSLLRPRARL